MHFVAVFNRQKTRGESLEALGHGFYGSMAKQSLQIQRKNYPKIHGQTKGSVAPLPSPEYATACHQSYSLQGTLLKWTNCGCDLAALHAVKLVCW